jgi:hypothetical protein
LFCFFNYFILYRAKIGITLLRYFFLDIHNFSK